MLTAIFKQVSSNQIIQHSIAKKLQSLVTVSQSVGIEGGVGEGLKEVCFVSPDVTDHVFELVVSVQQIEQVFLWLRYAGQSDQG